MSDMELPQHDEQADTEAPVDRPKGAPIESRFLFVDVAALRAKQLRRGATVRLDTLLEDPAMARAVKPERLAMEEVRQDLVPWSLPDFKVVVDLR